MIQVFCPYCHDFVPMKVVREQTISSKVFGKIQLAEFHCPKGHNWMRIDLVDDEESYLPESILVSALKARVSVGVESL